MVGRMRKLAAVLLSLLFVAPLAACGDDDDGGSGASGSGSTAESADGDGADSDDDGTAAEGDDEGDDGDDTGTDDDGDATDGDDTGDDGSDDGDTSGTPAPGFCTTADRFINDDSLAQLDLTNPDDVAVAVALLEDLRDDAPDEIADDVQVIIDVFQEVALAAAEAGPSQEEQEALAAEYADEIAALDEATAVLAEFTQEECGIDILGDSSTATTTP